MIKRSKQLPSNSLPLRYRLSPSLSNSSPCPCIVTSLPFRNHAESLTTSNTEVNTQDVRLGSTTAGVEVVRILDPEYREPFVSLSRIFLACSVSTLEGLLTYNLRRPDFDSSLAGIAPFKDIWVNLVTARKIATELNVIDELAGFLEWESRLAWSVEDKEVGGLIHNWKVSNEHILPDDYSTNSMLAASFPRLHLLPKGNQVRTLLPELSLSAGGTSTSLSHLTSSNNSNFLTTWESLYSKVVEWSIHEFETYLSFREEELTDNIYATNSESTTLYNSIVNNNNIEGEMALTIGSIFTTSLAFLSLSKSLPDSSLPSTEYIGSTLLIGSTKQYARQFLASNVDPEHVNSTSALPNSKEDNFLRLKKSELVSLASSTISTERRLDVMSKGVLCLCEFMNRLVIKEWRREEESRIMREQLKKGIQSSISIATQQEGLKLGAHRWIEFDERIKKLEEQESKKVERGGSLLSCPVNTLALEEQNEQLFTSLQEFRSKIQGLESRILELSEVTSPSGKEKVNFEQRRVWISARELNFVLGILLLGLIGFRINDYSTSVIYTV